MSYAAHNPELYDKLVRKGILSWLNGLIDKAGFEGPHEWEEGYEALIEVLQQEPQVRDIYEAMLHHASRDITRAEQDYFSGLIDHVVEQHNDVVDK